jgi:putative FmdB family regulatory protein
VPIYDYVCESCGHVEEVIHGISTPGPTTCERCGGVLKRALSTPAIVFKGSGWAKKDARDASRSRVSTSPTADGTKPDTAPTGGSGSSDTTHGAGTPATSSGSDAGASGSSTTGSAPATSATTSGGSGATPG